MYFFTIFKRIPLRIPQFFFILFMTKKLIKEIPPGRVFYIWGTSEVRGHSQIRGNLKFGGFCGDVRINLGKNPTKINHKEAGDEKKLKFLHPLEFERPLFVNF